jgi:hypothetical protein
MDEVIDTPLFDIYPAHGYAGGHNKAIKDLAKALAIDARFLAARDTRANMRAKGSLKDTEQRYTTSSSELFPRLTTKTTVVTSDAAYAWLTLMILGDPKLGTVEEAKQYYEKSMRATKRHDELAVRQARP